jgi:hypothetical protein
MVAVADDRSSIVDEDEEKNETDDHLLDPLRNLSLQMETGDDDDENINGTN